jgi:hypothetical protein
MALGSRPTHSPKDSIVVVARNPSPCYAPHMLGRFALRNLHEPENFPA